MVKLKSKRQQRAAAAKPLQLRIYEDSVLPAQLKNAQHATWASLFVAGEVLNGACMGQLLQHCTNLKKVLVERKDNDWDAPQKRICAIQNQTALACGIRNHPSLQEFSLTGVQEDCGSIDEIVQALCTCPLLKSVTLKVDSHSLLVNNQIITPETLDLLLNQTTTRLSLSGLFPETDPYTSVLQRHYVEHGAKTHIFLHFAGHAKPSAFCYYLRSIMEWNRLGRTAVTKPTLQKASQSLDVAFLMLQENPWLCQRTCQKAKKSIWRGLKWQKLIPRQKLIPLRKQRRGEQ